MKRHLATGLLLLGGAAWSSATPAPAPGATPAATVEMDLATVSAVDKFGKGHTEAQRALRDLCSARAADLPAFLVALDHASPLAANWIRNAFETVADKTLRQSGTLPIAELDRFVRDQTHQANARRLAFEWLVKVDPSAQQRLIPGMLHDPAPEFRREAVALRIEQAAAVPATDKARRISLLREALGGAVHEDQVKSIAKSLGDLGEKVEVSKHLAFITRFRIIGPFDNKQGKGFQRVYPPEQEIAPKAEYSGQIGKVSWAPLETTQEFGVVDIAKQVKPYKGAVMYLLAEFDSPHARTLELRLGTPNAWKVWLNGQALFARDEYHRGMIVDQYRVPVVMKAGRNRILLKICQNEQEQDWAQRYEFQLRVCDASGTGVLSQSTAQGSR